MQLKRLRFAVPNGSLKEVTLALLRKIGYPLPTTVGRDNRLGIIHDIVFEVRDRENIASLVCAGVFDCGITGTDLRLGENAAAANVKVLCTLQYSRQTTRPVEYVLAGRTGITRLQWEGMEKRRVGAERVALARHILGDRLRPDDVIVQLPGCEEMAVRDGLCDAVLVMTETGSSIKANNMEIIYPELLVSTPELLYCPGITDGSSLHQQIENIGHALQAILGAEGQIMVVFNIPTPQLPELKERLPAAVSPTISQTLDPEWRAGQVLIPRQRFGEVLRLLKASGASEIYMQDVDGYLP